MGSAVSSVVNYAKWVLGWDSDNSANEMALTPLAQPFIYSRRSSMCFDEDGDVAHEFYEEMVPSSGKPWMKQITENLFEQGMVKLKYPRLHVDFPLALYEGQI
eukprot:gene6765-7526_t